MLLRMDAARRKHLAWVNAILEHQGWNRTRLAREAGVDPSTLSKFFNDHTGAARLNTHTIERIQAVGGIPPFETAPLAKVRGLADKELDIASGVAEAQKRLLIGAMSGGNNGIFTVELRSRALETAGYLPGDLLVVDRDAPPHAGDVVYAELRDRGIFREAVARIYEHPFLVSATFDGGLFKPMLVDGDGVIITGVVVGSLRSRRAA